ncbi:MAG: ribosome maturation factor RimP [Vampirovibrionales bacterium]|jgi:ribosome maturation factor RimP
MKHQITETQAKRLCKTVLSVAIETLAKTPFIPVAVDVDNTQGRLILQVFVEKKDIRITLDECAEASLLLDAPLADLAELQAHSYVLELSSPGLFRHLKTFRELDFYTGKTVTLKPLDVAESKANAHLFAAKQLWDVKEEGSEIRVTLKHQAKENEAGELESFLLSELPEGQGICLAPPIQWPNDDHEDSDEDGFLSEEE